MYWLILLLVLLPSLSWAAISCEDANKVEFNSSAPADPTTIAYTTPSGSNQVLVVAASLRDTIDTFSSVTHAGNAMTAVVTPIFQDPVRTGIWYRANPTSGTNDVVIDFSGSTLGLAVVIFTCTGVDTASPIGTPVTNQAGSGTAVTVTVSDTSGQVTIDFFASDQQTTDATEGADQTVIHKGNDGGSDLGWGASYQAGGLGGVMSWTLGASQQWTTVAVPLNAAASTQRPIAPMILGWLSNLFNTKEAYAYEIPAQSVR